MSDAHETFEHAGIMVEIHHDDEPESPRDWENLGTMVCYHDRYRLGDKDNGFADVNDRLNYVDVNVVWRYMRRYAAVVLPLGLYDHSRISMYVSSGGHPCPWDSGDVGFIYVTRERVIKEWGDLSPESIDKAGRALRAEVETYDQYLTGNVWGYVVAPGTDDEDSCWGFFGADCCAREARDVAAAIASERSMRPLQLLLLPNA